MKSLIDKFWNKFMSSHSGRRVVLVGLIAIMFCSTAWAQSILADGEYRKITTKVEGSKSEKLSKYTNYVSETKLNHPSATMFLGDRNGNTSDIEVVGISYVNDTWRSRKYMVLSINDYKIYIKGLDGIIGRGLGTTHAILGDEVGKQLEKTAEDYFRDLILGESDDVISDERIVNPLNEFAYSPRNNAFPVYEIEMVIYPNKNRTGFTLNPPDVNDIRLSGKRKYDYGTRVFSTAEVKTNLGNYNVSFYSNASRLNFYNVVVIERKEDGMRCKVDGLREIDLVFLTQDGLKDSIKIKLIDISDPLLGMYTIIDDVMYDSLMTLKDDTVNRSDITFTSEKQRYKLSQTGIKRVD